jgi:hypothetical protein
MVQGGIGCGVLDADGPAEPISRRPRRTRQRAPEVHAMHHDIGLETGRSQPSTAALVDGLCSTKFITFQSSDPVFRVVPSRYWPTAGPTARGAFCGKIGQPHKGLPISQLVPWGHRPSPLCCWTTTIQPTSCRLSRSVVSWPVRPVTRTGARAAVQWLLSKIGSR